MGRKRLLIDNTLYRAKTICPTNSNEVTLSGKVLKAEPEMSYYRNALGKRWVREAGWKTSC